MTDSQDIKCPGCGKICGERCDGYIEQIRGGRKTRIYGAVAVVIECENCGKTFDIPGVLRLSSNT
ncbi:hypothetical protein ACFLXA_02725 [Chloroflexota bacterium]